MLRAYADQRQVLALSKVRFERRFVWSLPEARAALEKILGETLDWAPLDDYLIRFVVEPQWRATVRASSFSATLEMVREGVMEIRQDRAFAPLLVRVRAEKSVESDQVNPAEQGAAA